MPYHTAKGGGTCSPHQWAVIANDTGKTLGCHPTEDAANDQLAALYANVPDAQRTHRANQHTTTAQQAAHNRARATQGTTHAPPPEYPAPRRRTETRNPRACAR